MSHLAPYSKHSALGQETSGISISATLEDEDVEEEEEEEEVDDSDGCSTQEQPDSAVDSDVNYEPPEPPEHKSRRSKRRFRPKESQSFDESPNSSSRRSKRLIRKQRGKERKRSRSSLKDKPRFRFIVDILDIALRMGRGCLMVIQIKCWILVLQLNM